MLSRSLKEIVGGLELRLDGRRPDEVRRFSAQRGYVKYAEGSALVEMGGTKLICTASVEDKVPPFLRGTGQGWITAEYSMLPRATATRNVRDVTRGYPSGRSQEIQRLIGRALRAAVDLSLLGERTVWMDCDVIQADGGTRTAAINGGFVALVDALRKLLADGAIERFPLRGFVGAVSVGVVDGRLMLDLCYDEDSRASVDMNVVMLDAQQFVEVQGTGEGSTFGLEELSAMLELARKGIREIIERQKEILQITREEMSALEQNKARGGDLKPGKAEGDR